MLSTTSHTSIPFLDHQALCLGNSILVMGKNDQNSNQDQLLYRINTLTKDIMPIFSTATPKLTNPAMFSSGQTIYFWGKTSANKKNQLFAFDGAKFSKLDQGGPIPHRQTAYSYCFFANRYFLIFGGLEQGSFLNTWHLFDLEKLYWSQLKSNIQLQCCQSSSMVWIDGRGYICLYDSKIVKNVKTHTNICYEFKFQNFLKPYVICQEIELPESIANLTHSFSILHFDQKKVQFIGINQQNLKEQKKILYTFNIQTFSWSQQKNISIKGYKFKHVRCQNNIYIIGGLINEETLTKQIQIIQLESQNQILKKFQMSNCYFCLTPFSYKQQSIKSVAVDAQYQKFSPKLRIQNNFIQKFSYSFHSQFHSIGLIIDFFKSIRCKRLKICLQKGNSNPSQQFLQNYTPKENNILKFESSKVSSSSKNKFENQLQNKIASFKLGHSVIYVTRNEERSVQVKYFSSIRLQTPESIWRSSPLLSYTIKWEGSNPQYSSKLNRDIIFQNTKYFFQGPQVYENKHLLNVIQSQNKFYLYIIGVNNLQKTFQTSLLHATSISNPIDLKLKNKNSKNKNNSLIQYLKCLYLKNQIQIQLDGTTIHIDSKQQTFKKLQKQANIREIKINQEEVRSKNKPELEETHFTTHEDEIVSNCKPLLSLKNIKLYQKMDLQKKQKQKKIFNQDCSKIYVYSKSRMIKTLQTKGKLVCGFVELKENIQISMDSGDISSEIENQELIEWVNNMEKSIC